MSEEAQLSLEVAATAAAPEPATADIKASPPAAPRRESRPKWESYFMQMAEIAKIRSPDETQVGAVIVRDNVILATGYNGFARGVQEHEWRSDKTLEKLRWAVHAEQNAIFNAARVGVSLAGARIYTTKFPCLKCTNAIVQAGIKEIYTLDEKTYYDELLKEDGERTLQVLAETPVRLIAPKLRARPGRMKKVSPAGGSSRAA